MARITIFRCCLRADFQHIKLTVEDEVRMVVVADQCRLCMTSANGRCHVLIVQLTELPSS
jgi:hypothetical protein